MNNLYKGKVNHLNPMDDRSDLTRVEVSLLRASLRLEEAKQTKETRKPSSQFLAPSGSFPIRISNSNVSGLCKELQSTRQLFCIIKKKKIVGPSTQRKVIKTEENKIGETLIQAQSCSALKINKK